MHKAIPLFDKIVVITSYFTFGMTGVIWLIATYLIFKKPLTQFLAYHIYQSVFISILLYVISLFFSIAYAFTIKIPLIGNLIGGINLYLFNMPVFWTFTFANLIVFIILSYLSLGAFLGKLTYFPFISDVIKSNFRN